MLADSVHALIGRPPTVAVRTFEGDRAGPDAAVATLLVRSPDAMADVLRRPGELGVARAWARGTLDVDGDLLAALDAIDGALAVGFAPGAVAGLARHVRPHWRRLLAGRTPPPEEAQVHGRRHTRRRDRDAVTHHYDVGNDFYRLLLGPTMTYSCAVFEPDDADLDRAQARKHELVCRKLGLRPGARVLDIGCGWGGMLLHAARHHEVVGVGVTLSEEQAALARARVAAAELDGKIEIRVQDYRDVHDGPFDAVSSIGMFEHVGRAAAPEYAADVASLVRPGGRVLNHAITRPADPAPSTVWGRARRCLHHIAFALGSDVETRIDSPFFQRYVFPDGELFEVGAEVSLLQEAGLEVRHVESLREHYALTLRGWLGNLEQRWDEAVALVGAGRARVWRLYLAVSALGFDRGRTSVHQVLATRPDGSASGFPLRPAY